MNIQCIRYTCGSHGRHLWSGSTGIIPQWTIGTNDAISKCLIWIKLSHKIKQPVAFNNLWLILTTFNQAMRLQVTDVKFLSILIVIVLFQHLTDRAWIQLRWHKFLVSMIISPYQDHGFEISFSSHVQQICNPIHWDQS